MTQITRINQGWYQNLWVVLHGNPPVFRLEVRLVVNFFFRPDLTANPPDSAPDNFQSWSEADKIQWKNRFIELVENRWSRQHRLFGDISDRAIDIARLYSPQRPIADVDVRVIDAESPPEGMSVPRSQNINYIHVWRDVRGRAHGSAVTRVVALEEGDLDPQESRMGYSQTPALHEVGHLFGLVHAGCWRHMQSNHNDVVTMNQTRCYGEGPAAASVMGLGDRIRARDYVPFAYIMRRLQPQWIWFSYNERAERPGGRLASVNRHLLTPTSAWNRSAPGVNTRTARHPRYDRREHTG